MEQADSTTPFIRNAWYVIAEAAEVSRTPMARTALGTSVMLFRTLGGSVVALANRCCHRSFPLVHGTVDGDTVVCGYHGLRYDTHGPVHRRSRCRSRCLRRCGSWCFTRRRKARSCGYGWASARRPRATLRHTRNGSTIRMWAVRVGYLHVKGSYVHLHENLLDLSHLSFLHAKTFGMPEYARAPVEMNC